MLLDEPTSQLDPVAGDELVGLLRRLNEEWGWGSSSPSTGWNAVSRRPTECSRSTRGGSRSTAGPPTSATGRSLSIRARDPGARLFSLAGIRPLPVAVKDARRTLGERAIESAVRSPQSAVRGAERRVRRRRDRGWALRAHDVWLELDSGEAVRDVVRAVELSIVPASGLR